MSLLLLPQNNPPHIEVGWTLIHEFLFYVLFTFLVFNKKWGASIIIGWSISIVLAQLFFQDLVFPYSFFFAEINLLFGLGMLAAFLNQRVMKYRIHSYLFLIGSLLFVVTGIAQNKLYLTHDLALYFGFASFLITLGCNYQPIENFFRKRKFLNLIGNASYSIYLTHFFILAFLGILLSRLAIMESVHYIFIYLAIIPIALTGGLICYTVIEKPLLLYMRGKWRQWKAKSVAAAPRTAQAAESGR
jgi:peptidoglycan/LPS O-acetylase OafA/YrhL